MCIVMRSSNSLENKMMKNEKKAVGFVLQGIRLEQFAVFEDGYSPDNKSNVMTKLQFRIDGDNRLIGVFPGFEFTQEEKVFLKIEVSCHFKISEESWNSFLAEDQLRVPKDFMAHLAMITVGTARGVLFSKTEGSPFSRFILPTINVKEMVPEDLVIEL